MRIGVQPVLESPMHPLFMCLTNESSCPGNRPLALCQTPIIPPRLQAEARIAAALATNAQQLRERRAAFDDKQAHNEARRWCACMGPAASQFAQGQRGREAAAVHSCYSE